MATGEIDYFPVNQLSDRYQLARSAVYKRMGDLGIVPHKVGNKSFLDNEQIQLLDELHDFMLSGKNRTSAEFVEYKGLRSPRRPDRRERPQAAGSDLALPQSDLLGLLRELIPRLQPPPRPLDYLEQLEQAAINHWLVTTTDLADLLDVSPQQIRTVGGQFTMAGFCFTQAGYRPNGEMEWRVTKGYR